MLKRGLPILLLLLLLAVGVLVGIYWATEWPIVRYKGGIEISDAASIRMRDAQSDSAEEIQLDGEDQDNLRALLKQLPSMGKGVYDIPDLEFVAYVQGQEPAYYSVWLEEGYIYNGYFLEAWTERMIDDRADVYRINRETRNFLQELNAKIPNVIPNVIRRRNEMP